MTFVEKLENLEAQLKKDFPNLPRDAELVRCFANIFGLSDKDKFKVTTNKGLNAFLSPNRIREILVSDIPWRNPSKGMIGRREAAIALLKWEIEEPS